MAVHSPLVSSPERTCIGCRRREDQKLLLRLAAGPGAVLPDPDRRLGGRGAYIHASVECLEQARRKKAAQRALRVGGELDWSQVRTVVELHAGTRLHDHRANRE